MKETVLNGHAATARGMRTVAVFEAAKGMLVFVAGFGLLSLVHRDVQDVAERIVRHLHLNPARHYPKVFLEAAGHINDTELRSLAALACVYGIARLVEAYGLWHKKLWAEWFAVITGSLYLPIEAFEIIERVTWMKSMIFLLNALIVGYLAYVLALNRRTRVKIGARPPSD
jgi:uncharacterized membrane protein (DUF2068 family)